MVLIAAITVFLIRAVIVQPFLVSGASMEYSFIDGDYVLVDELSYRFKEPERGDVIVFRYPLNPKLFYIKRIMGVAGDRIVVNGGQVFINDKMIKEDYLRDGSTIGRSDIVLGDGEIFAMGDNRFHSYDSRNWGAVPIKNIIGLVKTRLLPAARAQVIERPAYEELKKEE